MSDLSYQVAGRLAQQEPAMFRLPIKLCDGFWVKPDDPK